VRPPSPIPGHRAPAADRGAVDRAAGAGASAYGELSAEATSRALRWLRLGPADELVDLGSGAGNVVIQAALESEVGLARGVELSRFRHRLARRRWSRVLREADPPRARALRHRVRFEWGDLRAATLERSTVIYAGSTCFPDSLLDALAELAHASPRVRLLLSTRALPARSSSLFSERGRLRVETSWDPRAWLYAYSPSRSVSKA